jgi:hypothetical protein
MIDNDFEKAEKLFSEKNNLVNKRPNSFEEELKKEASELFLPVQISTDEDDDYDEDEDENVDDYDDDYEEDDYEEDDYVNENNFTNGPSNIKFEFDEAEQMFNKLQNQQIEKKLGVKINEASTTISQELAKEFNEIKTSQINEFLNNNTANDYQIDELEQKFNLSQLQINVKTKNTTLIKNLIKLNIKF